MQSKTYLPKGRERGPAEPAQEGGADQGQNPPAAAEAKPPFPWPYPMLAAEQEAAAAEAGSTGINAVLPVPAGTEPLGSATSSWCGVALLEPLRTASTVHCPKKRAPNSGMEGNGFVVVGCTTDAEA